MIKRYKKRPEQKKFYRVNDRIFAVTLRVLDTEGKQIGVLSRFEALQKARELGLDLVEIAPAAKPPVAKIIDYKKFLYQEEKKKREEKKKTKESVTKEVRLGPFMSDNDLEVMIKRAREFITNGDKVRLVVKFRGRQIAHPEFGQQIIQKTIFSLRDISKTERDPHFEGKQLITIISKDTKKGLPAARLPAGQGRQENKDEKNEEISTQTVQSNEDRQSPVLPPIQKPQDGEKIQ